MYLLANLPTSPRSGLFLKMLTLVAVFLRYTVLPAAFYSVNECVLKFCKIFLSPTLITSNLYYSWVPLSRSLTHSIHTNEFCVTSVLLMGKLWLRFTKKWWWCCCQRETK